MASGEYILVETDLPKQRKTIAISRRCGWSAYETVGRLVDFWGWITGQRVVVLGDGDRGALVDVDVDALVDAGVAPRELLNALISVGWLEIGEIEKQPAIVVPHYNSWLSKSGKARALKAFRQRRWRQASNYVGADVGAEGDAGVDAPEYAPKKELIKSNNTPCSPPRKKGSKARQYTDAFGLFWAAYPRREAKGAAFDAFEAALSRIGDRDGKPAWQFIVERVRAYALATAGTDRIHPHPTTWLNQDRFDDDPRAWTEPRPAPSSTASSDQVHFFPAKPQANVNP